LFFVFLTAGYVLLVPPATWMSTLAEFVVPSRLPEMFIAFEPNIKLPQRCQYADPFANPFPNPFDQDRACLVVRMRRDT